MLIDGLLWISWPLFILSTRLVIRSPSPCYLPPALELKGLMGKGINPRGLGRERGLRVKYRGKMVLVEGDNLGLEY